MSARCLILLLIQILILGSAPTVSADPCSDAWKDMIRNPEMEIAQLLAEKHNLSGPTAPALGKILDVDIERKLLELERQTGTVLSPQQRAELVDAASKKQNVDQDVTNSQEQVKRLTEVDYRVFTEQYRKPVGTSIFDPSWIQPPQTHPMSKILNADGRGAQWTDDERFVLIRPTSEYAQVIDLETGAPVLVNATKGYLTPGGLWHGQTDQRKTLVTDLRTGQEWGPFDGIPTSAFRNDRFVVTLPTERSNQYRIYRKETGEFRDVGSVLILDFDSSRVVFRNHENKLEVFDVDAWKRVKTYPESLLPTDPKQKGFFVRQGNVKHRLVRLRDLKSWPLDCEQADQVYAQDETHVAVRISSGHRWAQSHLFMELSSGATKRFDKVFDFKMKPSRRHISFGREVDGHHETVLFDFSTMTERVVKGNRKFSPDGQWAFQPIDVNVSKVRIKALHLESNQSLDLMSVNDKIFHPDSRHLFTTDPQTLRVNYLPPASQGSDILSIGEGFVSFSPSGKYVLTLNGDELVILRFKP